MNKKIVLGLVIGAVLTILIAILYAFYLGSSPKIGPSAVTTPAPPAPVAPGSPTAPEPLASPSPAPPVPSPGVVPGTEAPATPKVLMLPPLQEKNQYGLLAGHYRSYREANNMLARLKKQGKPAFVQRDPKDPSRYELWVGPWPSRREAEDAKKSLRTAFKTTPKIQEIENPVPK